MALNFKIFFPKSYDYNYLLYTIGQKNRNTLQILINNL